MAAQGGGEASDYLSDLIAFLCSTFAVFTHLPVSCLSLVHIHMCSHSLTPSHSHITHTLTHSHTHSLTHTLAQFHSVWRLLPFSFYFKVHQCVLHFLNTKPALSVKAHVHLYYSMLISHASDGLILAVLLHTFVKSFCYFTFTCSHV